MTGRHRTAPRGTRATTGVRAPGGAGRHTGAGLAWRQFVADPWVSAALAVLVALVSFLLTAVPRALEDVNARQLVQDLGLLSAQQRDVTGAWGTTVETAVGSVDQDGQPTALDPWQAFREGAERVRSAQPEPLRTVLQKAQMTARVTNALDHVPAVESGYYNAQVTVRADPGLTEHVELVEGGWPELEQTVLPDPREAEGPVARGPQQPTGPLVPVVVLEEAAAEMLWEVGEEIAGRLELVGTYRPVDPDDPRWQHVDNGTTMGVLADPNRGEQGTITAFVSPLSRGFLGQPTAVRTEVWYPVDAAAVTTGRVDTAELRRQLTGMLAQQHVLVPGGDPALSVLEGDQVPAFTTGLTDALDKVVRQQRATASLLAVVAAGPLGVAAAVLALAARLVVSRRRAALAMVLARGASPRQLRWLVAGEGLALGVPAALLGHVLAVAAVPGAGRWWEWLVTAAVAATPAVALAATLDDASLLHERRDLSGRSRSRWRWVVELSVVVLAGLATWRLLDRETRGDAAADSGIDLLAAAAPVLLALVACSVALRLYPLPLAALVRVLRSGRGLTPFLGAARALRDPAGGLVPTLAVVLGTSVALVSAVLLTTVTHGADAAAWERNGADVRVRGPQMTDEVVAALRDIKGVEAVARLRDAGTTFELSAGQDRTPVRVLLADAELSSVMPAGGPAGGPPPGLYAEGGPVPVLAGGSAPARSGPASVRGVGEVVVLGHAAELPGFRTPGSWVLISAERWEGAGRSVPAATTALVSLADGADHGRVADEVEGVLGSSVVTTVEQELDAFASAPVTTGLTRAFVGATVLTGLLTVLAIVVVQLMGADARARLLAVLRTLGLGARQTRALTAWELAPMVLTSIVVGAVLGLVVPWVLVRALDLTGVTGGRAQPPLSLDPLLVGAVLAAVVLTVLLAITVSAWLAGRTNLAQALRVGEER
ncbi:ABC transporter permease [Ornithinimicrobium cerasi]|uniref:Putative ABC transport system permease protein n=1 Tax=Ornithinimicrobium cerasi TaxID=2248773 RepID=A0A285VUT7_9MICO|nr:ABC transporter permease [Ornithinimicrobium cerasi]SOC57378.1 putative ABC transport system permease protein [Ornithinimicrobium cerasi]